MLAACLVRDSCGVHSTSCHGPCVAWHHAGRVAGERKYPCLLRGPHVTLSKYRTEAHEAAGADLWKRPHPGCAWVICTWCVHLRRGHAHATSLRFAPTHHQLSHARFVRTALHPSLSSRAAPSMGWRQRRARRHMVPHPRAHLPEHEKQAGRRVAGIAAGYFWQHP